MFSEFKSVSREYCRCFIQHEHLQLLILVTLSSYESLHWQLPIIKEPKLTTQIYECKHKYLEGGLIAWPFNRTNYAMLWLGRYLVYSTNNEVFHVKENCSYTISKYLFTLISVSSLFYQWVQLARWFCIVAYMVQCWVKLLVSFSP